MLTHAQRQYFDDQLEQVLKGLPPSVHQIIEEVPLVVEDYPAPDVLAEHGIEDPHELCGLYSGTPLTEPEVRDATRAFDHILLYRAGIFAAAANDEGQVHDEALREQIRITILHEVGHHHGLDEDDLEELGYE